MKRVTATVIVSLSLLLPSIGTRGQTGSGTSAQSRSMIDNLRAAGGFSQLLLLIDKAGLDATLSSRTQAVTFFALEDKTLLKLPKGTLDSLLKDSAKSRAFLLPYIVSGLFNSDDLLNAASHHASLHSLSGQSVGLSTDKSPKTPLLLTYDPCPVEWGRPTTQKKELVSCSARIISANHRTANGYYHIIASTDGGIWR
jgi:hypothetical protein